MILWKDSHSTIFLVWNESIKRKDVYEKIYLNKIVLSFLNKKPVYKDLTAELVEPVEWGTLRSQVNVITHYCHSCPTTCTRVFNAFRDSYNFGNATRECVRSNGTLIFVDTLCHFIIKVTSNYFPPLFRLIPPIN